MEKLHEVDNFSIDIETLGTARNSYITSIGVAKFNILTGEIEEPFYQKTKCSDDYKIDINTVRFWMGQSDEARNEFVNAEGIEAPMHDTLMHLANFLEGVRVIGRKENYLVWGNGATFDISLLEDAYNIQRMKPPWDFRHIRDMRTIVSVAYSLGFDRGQVKREGTHHNALDDAIYQGQVMAAAYKHLVNMVEDSHPGILNA